MNNFEYQEVAPCVFLFENVIDNCMELINLANLQNSSWIDAVLTHESFVDKNVRNTKTVDISPSFKNDVEWFVLAKRLWEYGDFYAKKNGISFSEMEHPQFLKYLPNEGHYTAHSDSSREMPRIFSSVLYLNDVQDGGETYFNNFNVSVEAKAGRLAMFPANFAYLHEAKMPKSNDKNVIVTWFVP